METYLASVPAHRTDTSCFDASLAYHPDRILSADALRLRGWQRMQAYNRLQQSRKNCGNYPKCNGHHRELWCGLVFVLMQELRKCHEQDPKAYEQQLRAKIFVVETNRKNLQATMLARYSKDEEQQGVCLRTISNLLDRLVELGLIQREKGSCPKANFKIQFSPRFLMLQKLQLTYNSNGTEKKEKNSDSNVDKFSAAIPMLQKLQLTYNSNGIEKKENSSGELVDKFFKFFSEEPSAKINELVRSKTGSNTLAEPKQVAAAASDYAQRVDKHSIGQAKEHFFTQQLWAQAKNCLYPTWRFHPSTEKDILALLYPFLQNEAILIAAENEHALQQFCAENPKYLEAKKAKNEERLINLRQWLRSRQVDPWNEAFSLLSRALDIQRQYCEKEQKKTYEPYTFFSQAQWAFERVIGFAKKEAQTLERQAQRSEKKETTLIHAKLKCSAKKFLLQTTLLLRDRGTAAALQKYSEGRTALIELLKTTTALSEKQKWNYLHAYNTRLQHLFNPPNTKNHGI